jgi:hypothetical protein
MHGVVGTLGLAVRAGHVARAVPSTERVPNRRVLAYAARRDGRAEPP